MRKPIELRRHLEAAVPQLRRNPEQLAMHITRGEVLATGTRALSWQYSYTLQVVLLDWATHPDVVMAPLLAWLRLHQNELLDNPKHRGIRFQAEYLNAQTLDMVIDLDLTERVLAKPREGQPGQLDLQHLQDTPPLHFDRAERLTVYIEGEQVAQWDYLPDDPLQPLRPPLAQRNG